MRSSADACDESFAMLSMADGLPDLRTESLVVPMDLGKS